MITLDHITVVLPVGDRDGRTILSDVSLEIGRGDWITLVGPNGSGKSTLLRTLAGLVPVRSGSIRYDDGERPRIGVLLQEPDNQFVASTVRNELVLSLPPDTAIDDEEACVRAAVRAFHLEPFLARNPHRLSGGEKQRLALATVQLFDCDLVLLDEPTGYLDAEQRERCRTFVTALNRAGVAVVWASPEGDGIEGATHCVELHEGGVAFSGAASDYAVRGPGNGDWPGTIPGPPASVGGPIVSCEEVTFSYGDERVLDGVSLTCSPGECLGVTGRNGSGKSTLLALMSGVLSPTAGHIRRPFREPVSHGVQNVFHLFQSPERLFFAETVYEEMAFGLQALGVGETDRRLRIEEALAGVGLDHGVVAERSPFHLSFGEMRRVAFAMAAVLRPKLLIMDEPTSCLDRSGHDVLASLVERFVESGSALVIASHDERVTRRLCHRSYELE